MQVSRTNELQGGRAYYSIGRIKASSGWRAANAHGSEGARLEALWALVSEAQEFYADAVIDLSFEVDAIGEAPGQFIAPHGIAVDSRGDIYVAEVANTYWPQLFGKKPDHELRSLQKLARVS